MENIVDTLQDKFIFNTFLRAINETNFSKILGGKGPFTVLAPTDEAFENLPPESLDQLFHDKSELLDVISQHIVIGKLNSAEIEKMDELPTMANQTLAVEKHNEGLIIGGAKIVEPDVICINGIIHSVDVVLMP